VRWTAIAVLAQGWDLLMAYNRNTADLVLH
jgi:hypothetical protein